MIGGMEAGAADDLVRRGWEALAAADWDVARSNFEQACGFGESVEALDGLGRALHFRGEYARAIELTERAFAAYRQLDRPVEAADRARWLAFLHGTINSNMAVASGWMARAESLLAGADECAGHGWLALDRAPFTDDGDIFCRLLSACEISLDVTRAEQWMSVAGRFDAWSDFVSPVCRSHYGGILIAVGRWTEAEEELLAAIGTFEKSYRGMRGSPLVKLADLRVRQGRLEEAAAAGGQRVPPDRQAGASHDRARARRGRAG